MGWSGMEWNDPALGPFQERKSYKWKQLLFFFTFITFAFAVCVYFHHNWYCGPGGEGAAWGGVWGRAGCSQNYRITGSLRLEELPRIRKPQLCPMPTLSPSPQH